MLPSLSCAALCLSLASRSLAQSLSLSPSSKPNSAASSVLDASFSGFGIEPSNLFSFTGNANTNSFSVQLLQNLADYAGRPPHIRLGGNTQDYFVYDSTYNDYGWKKNTQSSAQGTIAADSMIIGPSYFKALDRFPKNTPVTYGLNLAYANADYQDRIVAMAQAAVDGMQNVKLYSFEVGNEPDLYLQNLFRNGTWSGKTYTQQFLDRADAVYQRVLKPAGLSPLFFEPPATASTIGTTFEISQLVNDGLLDDTNGNQYVSVWNQHDYFYFIGVTTTPITLNDLMDLDQTNTQFAYWEKQVAIGLKTGLPYVLREMSSIGPIGMHGVSDTFGASLWTLNFLCYMASINVSSVQMHMTDNSNASAWQPNTQYGNPAFVRPQYYAHVAMAQVVGNGNGTTQIAVQSVSGASSGYTGRVRAYAAYANSALQAMVLINSKQVNASSSSSAGSFTFNVNFGSSNGNKNVYLSYLTADGADSLSGTTFNGMTFSNTDGKMAMADSSVHIVKTSSSGSVSIPVRDSQAIVANLDWLLGSNAVLTVNGTTTPSSRKKSAAGPTSTSGASTAAWTGILTTTFAIASSLAGTSDASQAQETGSDDSNKKKGEAVDSFGVRWKTLGVCLAAIVVSLAYVA